MDLFFSPFIKTYFFNPFFMIFSLMLYFQTKSFLKFSIITTIGHKAIPRKSLSYQLTDQLEISTHRLMKQQVGYSFFDI